ncbi:U11/U12 small nuclear ribonucleoprotein 65 kDa protein-like isoform X13 [Nicotiana tabacum]|uniref:U11/U12 small nuclear ribonucleoprotein 65 kDa protein-like isoform X13 n=1 Tax=Nicotiana tabacum TaxID=4097 RepID=A0AC58UKA7_TOBAC
MDAYMTGIPLHHLPREEAKECTLLIRHLPEAVPHETLSRLLSNYGASSIRPCTSGRFESGSYVFLDRVRNYVFVDFKDESLAHQAQQHLNGYVYPPPDGHILTNIVNALIAVPRFYTQVLHLMNKMNIPAPFRMALPTPPLPTSLSVPPPPPPPPPPTVSESRLENLSSSESEMESSDESNVGGPKQKRARREAILGPAVDKDVAHEAVGLRAAALVPKEMPVVKKKNPIIQIKVAPKQVQNEEKGDMREISLPVEDKENDNKTFATLEELKSGRLPPEEILSLPMFKNYCAGNPSPILYLKNLAKEVIVDDFYFIFAIMFAGSLFGSIDEAKSRLAVKLMQEGRMRGQAFVTFPSVELAQDALNLVNGYVFKGKPIVIQFGRDPAKAKTS